jgi:hypothetical protein
MLKNIERKNKEILKPMKLLTTLLTCLVYCSRDRYVFKKKKIPTSDQDPIQPKAKTLSDPDPHHKTRGKNLISE